MEPTTMLRAKDPEAIRALAEQKGLTPTKFGRAVGISTQRVWKLYYGETRIAADKAVSIASALGVPIASLFELPDGAELKKLKLI